MSRLTELCQIPNPGQRPGLGSLCQLCCSSHFGTRFRPDLLSHPDSYGSCWDMWDCMRSHTLQPQMSLQVLQGQLLFSFSLCCFCLFLFVSSLTLSAYTKTPE